MHRSKSICLIYIASHIRFYNWYLNMWKTMLSALNKMVVLDLGVIIYQSLMLTATHFLFQLLWFCILCIKEDRPPIESPVRTGPCNRFSDLEPFGTLPVCWTVGPGGHSILDLVRGSDRGPRGDPDGGGHVGIGSHLAPHLRVLHCLGINCRDVLSWTSGSGGAHWVIWS